MDKFRSTVSENKTIIFALGLGGGLAYLIYRNRSRKNKKLKEGDERKVVLTVEIPAGEMSPMKETMFAGGFDKTIGDLSFLLYKKIVSALPKKNVIFSPTSIALCLAMLESGACGETRVEIRRVFGADERDEIDLSSIYGSFQRRLNAPVEYTDNNGECQLGKMSVVNCVFYDETICPKEEYQKKARRRFNLEMKKMAFGTSPEVSLLQINALVSDATAAKIPELFKGSLSKSHRLIVGNAAKFKMHWRFEFDSGTKPRAFYRFGNKDDTQMVPFMRNENTFKSIDDASADGVDVVELLCRDERFAMYVVLPKQHDGIGKVEQSLDNEYLLALFRQTDKAEQRATYLAIPKFTFRLALDLKEISKELGLRKLFATDGCDLSRMVDDGVLVDKAVHEAFIEVDETGTEVGAAAGFNWRRYDHCGSLKYFIADHPFMFGIVHKPTWAVLFMGKVNYIESAEGM